MIALGVLWSLPAPAFAQNCGDWYRPVVCTAELVATDSDRNEVRLDDGTRIELGPREQIDLQLDARDQRGMRFPSERLALRFDDYDCRSILSVQDREGGCYA